MTAKTSTAEDSIRTMHEDLKKARRGSRPVPQIRKPSPPSLSGRDLQGKSRLEEIMSHADGGESSVLQDLRSSKQSSVLKPAPTKPPEDLDNLLPIEDTQTPDTSPHAIVLPTTPPPQTSLEIKQGSPPPNLPRQGLSETPSPPEQQVTPTPTEPVSAPSHIQRTTAEGLEEHEKPQETPEELLDLSTPPPKADQPRADAPVPPQTPSRAPADKPTPTYEQVPPPASPESHQDGQDVVEKRRPWKFIAILVALITLGSVSGFLIWNFLIANEEAPAPIAPPIEEPVIKTPGALIPTNLELIVQSAEEVRALEFISISPEQTIYIPYYLENDKRFANPEEFFAALGIQAPPPFFRLISNAVTLYLYMPGNEEFERCSQEGITDASCSSPRLGMIFRATPENLDLVRGVMEDWEGTMTADILPLVFGEPSLPTAPFSSATYRDVAVRFVNLPISTTAINYALTDSFVVIATSKNSLYTVLDTIIEISP